MAQEKTKPSYNKEWANKVGEAEFVKAMIKAYPDLTEADLKKDFAKLKEK